MVQIKLTVSNSFKKNIERRAKNIGVKTTQYIVSLIINDLNKKNNGDKND